MNKKNHHKANEDQKFSQEPSHTHSEKSSPLHKTSSDSVPCCHSSSSEDSPATDEHRNNDHQANSYHGEHDPCHAIHPRDTNEANDAHNTDNAPDAHGSHHHPHHDSHHDQTAAPGSPALLLSPESHQHADEHSEHHQGHASQANSHSTHESSHLAHEHSHSAETACHHHHHQASDHTHPAHHDHCHNTEDFKKRFWVSLVLTVPVLLLSEMIQMWFGFKLTIPFQQYILFAFASLIYFYGGWPFLTGAIDELKQRLPGMMTLIGTAVTGAFIYSGATIFFIHGKDFFWELATLIDIMLLGHWLEAKSVLGASRALEELVKIMPTNAHLLKNGEIVDVPVAELRKGDRVLVRPGEKIPSDGTVVEGESLVNEALLTGESKPVRKASGHKVIGGSINGDGVLQILIEKTGEETYLAQVVKLVRQAQASRSRTQDLANRSAALLFYVALVAGIASYAVWSFLKTPDFALERAVTVLVIACPHALGLAIPLVVAISTSIAARNGILIRNRRAFEAVKDVDVVVFDKTGTLTEGQFGISDVVALIPEDELLSLAAAVEINSEHVIAKAIISHAQKMGISLAQLPQARDFRAIPGKGVSAVVKGKEVYVGGANLLEELKIDLEDQRLKSVLERGESAVVVIVEGKPAGVIVLSDRIRPESFEAVKRLKEMKIKVFMLTGDSEEVARSVAEELGIDDYFSQVLPHEKAEKVRLLRERGYRVAMVGDGINDAPALATADVGIAIGAGTDVAIESADVILVKNDPADVARMISISRRTFAKMVQNLWWAAGYNIITIPLAAGVLYGQGIVISPALGAVLMSLSTVIVAFNAQTLKIGTHYIFPIFLPCTLYERRIV